MIFGILATLIVLFILSVLRLFLTRVTHRPFRNVIPYLRPDGEEILWDLMDAAVERTLAQNLSHKQFREEQQDRMRLADEHLGHRSHNAVVLQGWGDTELRKARETGDREIQAAADVLVIACAEYRIAASAVQFQLHIWQFKLILLPFARLPRVSHLRKADDLDMFDSYEKIKETALKLAGLCGGDYYEQLVQAL